MTTEIIRCQWAGPQAIYINYHDNEWGRPCHEELPLFEKLILEGMQAGLSWITILNKRKTFRLAFDGFDPEKIARYDDEKFQELMENPGIIRNKLKIRAAIGNAQAYLRLRDSGGSLDDLFWKHVDYGTKINHWADISQVPASTETSGKIAKELKSLGFRFVGSTTMYAHMQAMGMVNDHTTDCFCWQIITDLAKNNNNAKKQST